MRTLSRPDVEAAVKKLADTFGFDPQFARVYQLELAATLPMPRPVASYLAVLGRTPRFKRISYDGETVMYENKRRSLSFYDKAKEAGVSGHLLRFEVKYKQKLKDQIGWALVLSDLYDRDCFSRLVERWLQEYRRVPKVRRYVLSPPSGVPDLKQKLTGIGLEAVGGEVAVWSMLQAWDMDRQVRFACNRALRELAEAGTLAEDTALTGELDEAVKRAVLLALEA